jgi:hypothetical protein
MRPDEKGAVNEPQGTLRMSLRNFTADGYGSVYGTIPDALVMGQRLWVWDSDGRGIFEAGVVALRGGEADLHVHGNRPKDQ